MGIRYLTSGADNCNFLFSSPYLDTYMAGINLDTRRSKTNSSLRGLPATVTRMGTQKPGKLQESRPPCLGGSNRQRQKRLAWKAQVK